MVAKKALSDVPLKQYPAVSCTAILISPQWITWTLALHSPPAAAGEKPSKFGRNARMTLTWIIHEAPG
jgi:hypothetical protein